MNMKLNQPTKKTRFGWLKLLTVAIFCIGFSVKVFGQNQTHSVTGVVSSAGEPLIGASVVEKGTTNGSLTDIDGVFTLKLSPKSTIEISYLGFETQTIAVNGRTKIDVELREASNVLNEVVAIGYGVQKKKLTTGANLQVKGDDLQKRSTTTALGALQGQTPGVQITSMSGQPGDGFKVLVRGTGTIYNSAPLYIVDGVQVSDINHINNADIESIDVLKDGASAAIYGSQAANGVVLVTTKTGSKDNAKISFDAYYGVQNIARKPKMLNAQQYGIIMNEQNINSGGTPYFTNSEISGLGSGTRWANEMFDNGAPTQSYTLSALGGSDTSIYSISLGYTSQAGVVGGADYSNYERYSFRVNTEHRLYKNIIKVGQHTTFTYAKNKGVNTGDQYSNTLRGALNTSPLLPMYDDDGKFINTDIPTHQVNGETWNTWYNGESNPYAAMVYTNNNNKATQKLVGDVYLEINPMKDLKFRSTLGLDYFSEDYRSFTPEFKLSKYDFKIDPEVSQSMTKGTAWSWDNVASYELNLKNEHNFMFMGGMSARRYSGAMMFIRNAGYLNDNLSHAWIDNTINQDGAKIGINGAPLDEEKLLSYFARVNYNWQEKYMLNATFRADGSSKFMKGNRWGYFPSVSAGWIVSSESWMQSTASWLDYLKVRASWGLTGNQNIPQYKQYSLINTQNGSYIFGESNGADKNVSGAYPSSTLGNPDLKWERSEQYNLGFDTHFLNNRLIANIDIYYKDTKDWLVQIPMLATSGTTSKWINGGNVVNKGIELGLSYNDRIGKDFSYNIAGNITYNKNKVGRIATDDGIIHGSINQLYDNSPEFYRAESGKPIGYFWGYKTNGIFQNQEQIDSYVGPDGKKIQPNAVPGDVIYVDANNDGVISENDKRDIGNPNPDYTFGISLGMNYKDFDFQIVTNGVLGNQLVQSYRNHTNRFANYTTRVLDRWHGEGTSNKMPRLTNANVNWDFSDLYVQDGDFWRISNITLGYNFHKMLKTNFISQLRVYASVQNLWTFTKYDGMDPEIGYGVGSFASGVDVGFYPNARTFLFGVNVKF